MIYVMTMMMESSIIMENLKTIKKLQTRRARRPRRYEPSSVKE